MKLGRSVPEGLALGIDQESSRVEAAAERLAAAAIPDIGTAYADLGVAGDAALTSSLSAHAEQQVLIGFDQSMSGDVVLDAIKSRIKVRHNGSVQAALGSTR